MRRILQFLRLTLVGGILFLVPFVALLFFIGKALAIAHKLTDPLAARIPVHSVIGLRTPVLLASAVLVLFCFVVGLFARTALAQKIIDWLEAAVLSNVPGYVFLKSLSESFLGAETEAVYQVVLARIEDAWQLGFLIERLEGGHVAVFVPGAPNPLSGSVYFMSEDRIRPTNIPALAALKCLKRLGVGSNALLRDIVAP